MRTDRIGRKHTLRGGCAALAAVMMLLCLSAGAAEQDAAAALRDPDLILAQDAAGRMDLRGEDGNPVAVRSDPSVPGRGLPGADGAAPDYVGLIGFAALPNDSEVNRFSLYEKAFWTVPVFKTAAEGHAADGYLAHKTPVVVIGQELAEDGSGRYTGFLDVIRLDSGDHCAIGADAFVTAAYWTMNVGSMPEYGYSIAVYRESPGAGPRDENGKSFAIRDGTRVLIPCRGACPDTNPDPAHLTVQGIVFRDEGAGIAQKLVYFREKDLVPNY